MRLRAGAKVRKGLRQLISALFYHIRWTLVGTMQSFIKGTVSQLLPIIGSSIPYPTMTVHRVTR